MLARLPSSRRPRVLSAPGETRRIRWLRTWLRLSARVPARRAASRQLRTQCFFLPVSRIAGSDEGRNTGSSHSGFTGDFFGGRFFLCVVRFNVVVENLDELGDNAVALQRGEQAAIYIDGSFGFLERSGQGNTETGVFRFAGAIDHAAHDRHLHLFDSGVTALPYWHLLASIGLNLLCHFLEESAGGS